MLFVGRLLVQWLYKPWLCFSAVIIQSLRYNSNLWFNLFCSFSSFPLLFFSLLQLLLHLTPNSTASSCVLLGSVSTPDFSITCSWTPSRSQMCYLFMLKHLGLNTVLSLQHGKSAKKFDWQLAGRLHHPGKPGRHFKVVWGEAKVRGMKGDGNPGEARSSHSPMLWLLDKSSKTGRLWV